MPDIPADLIALQRERLAAQDAVTTYAASVEAHLRAEPDPELELLGLRWSDDERAELARLRAARDELAAAVRAHPHLVQAHAAGQWASTWDALQAAARKAAELQQA